MPFKLYNNIHKYLESKSSSQEKYDVNSLIDSLPFTLKNIILFTMYKSVIKNFQFFKKNGNSEFIAQVLTNFIPIISKRNEFLVYEGEMIEEIIFIKDGKISLSAAINLEDPSTSINKYFKDKFSPFTSDEEKNLLGSILNDNYLNKSVGVSSMNGEITYDTAKTKINNAFKTLKNKTSDERNIFELNNIIGKNKTNDFCKFDVNGGVINNEDGSYQYLKILDIRKNEHFGCVFMTLKKPCPLTLQVKSNFAELYLFKKEQAVATSKSYPNIWKRLYAKEFHNLRAIKDLTFRALKKYIELNQLLLELNLDDVISKNDLTINDLNELEKSIYTEKSNIMKPLVQYKKTISNNITKFKTMNSESDKKQKRISQGRIYVQNQKDKITSFKKKLKGSNLYSHSIIYNNASKDKIIQLENIGSDNHSNLNQTNQRSIAAKMIHFADDNIITKISKDEGINKENFGFKTKISSSDIFTNDEHESEIKSNINKNRAKYERINKLKKFLIKCKNKLKIRQYEENKYKKKNEITEPNFQMTKGILKENNNYNQINIIKKDEQINHKIESKNLGINKVYQDNIENSNIKLISNNNNRNNDEVSLIKDLENYFNEENNFSFLKTLNFEDLSIKNDINLEILSSYDNLNQLSKGKYIFDYHAQNKIKLKIKKYFIRKSSDNYTLSLKSLDLSQDFKGNVKLYKKKKKDTKKSFDKRKSSKKKVKNSSKSHKIQGKIMDSKIYQKERKKDYETDFKINNNKNKPSLSIENKLNNKVDIKNENINSLNNNNNFTFYPCSSKISVQNTIKENISSNDIDNSNNSISFSKKISEIISKNDSLDINIKQNKHIYKKSEVEFEINKSFSKINYKNNPINIINSNNIYRNKGHNKKNGNNKSKKNNNKERKISDKILGKKCPGTNIITNNIMTNSSNNNDNKNNFNTNEKKNNIEASFNIYNIIQKNVNKNLNIIDNKDIINQNGLNKSFCIIY